MYSGVETGIKVLEWLGVIEKELSNNERFDQLEQELLQGVGLLYGQGVQIDRANALAHATTASILVNEAQTPPTPGGFADAFSILAVQIS